MKKIEKNNNLIAKFMGIYFKNNEYQIDNENLRWMVIIANSLINDTEEQIFYFHDDWSWLMEAVFKCLEICHNEMLNEWENGFSDSFFSRDINCMYSEVVRFIKWYNNKPLVNPDEVKNNSSNKRDRVLKSIMERYGGLWNLKSAMREDEDVVLVNLCDDLNDEFSEFEVLDEIMAIFK